MFVIAEDGEITVNDYVVDTVIMKNKKVKVELPDSDKENNNKPEDSTNQNTDKPNDLEENNNNLNNKEEGKEDLNTKENQVTEQVKTGDNIVCFCGLLVVSVGILMILKKEKCKK